MAEQWSFEVTVKKRKKRDGRNTDGTSTLFGLGLCQRNILPGIMSVMLVEHISIYIVSYVCTTYTICNVCNVVEHIFIINICNFCGHEVCNVCGPNVCNQILLH